MSDQSKRVGSTMAKVGAVAAALGLLWRICADVAVVARDFGSVTTTMKAIQEKLDTHVRQTEDFRRNVEERLRKIEGRVGIVMNMDTE